MIANSGSLHWAKKAIDVSIDSRIIEYTLLGQGITLRSNDMRTRRLQDMAIKSTEGEMAYLT